MTCAVQSSNSLTSPVLAACRAVREVCVAGDGHNNLAFLKIHPVGFFVSVLQCFGASSFVYKRLRAN